MAKRRSARVGLATLAGAGVLFVTLASFVLLLGLTKRDVRFRQWSVGVRLLPRPAKRQANAAPVRRVVTISYAKREMTDEQRLFVFALTRHYTFPRSVRISGRQAGQPMFMQTEHNHKPVPPEVSISAREVKHNQNFDLVMENPKRVITH